REQRTAEESGLLTGDDRDRAPIGEEPARIAGAPRRLTALLLAGDDRSDTLAAVIVRLRARDRVGPRRPLGGIAGKKRRDRSKIVRIVRSEPPDPREPA